MHNEALKDNIQIKVISALRNFKYQKFLWDASFAKKKQIFPTFNDYEIVEKVMNYLAMPSTSRHHWGTDIDINSVEPEYFELD